MRQCAEFNLFLLFMNKTDLQATKFKLVGFSAGACACFLKNLRLFCGAIAAILTLFKRCQVLPLFFA